MGILEGASGPGAGEVGHLIRQKSVAVIQDGCQSSRKASIVWSNGVVYVQYKTQSSLMMKSHRPTRLNLDKLLIDPINSRSTVLFEELRTPLIYAEAILRVCSKRRIPSTFRSIITRIVELCRSGACPVDDATSPAHASLEWLPRAACRLGTALA